MNDPISDLLTRIRNANRALLPDVDVPHSKIKESIVDLMARLAIAKALTEGQVYYGTDNR